LHLAYCQHIFDQEKVAHRMKLVNALKSINGFKPSFNSCFSHKTQMYVHTQLLGDIINTQYTLEITGDAV